VANQQDTKAALEQLIADNWTITEIAYDNIPYKQTQGVEFIAPHVMFDHAQNVNIGAMTYKRVRHAGQLVIRIYTLIDTGSVRAYALGEDLITLLSNRYVGTNIVTYAGSIRRNSNEIDGFYSVILTINFDSDDC